MLTMMLVSMSKVLSKRQQFVASALVPPQLMTMTMTTKALSVLLFALSCCFFCVFLNTFLHLKRIVRINP